MDSTLIAIMDVLLAVPLARHANLPLNASLVLPVDTLPIHREFALLFVVME